MNSLSPSKWRVLRLSTLLGVACLPVLVLLPGCSGGSNGFSGIGGGNGGGGNGGGSQVSRTSGTLDLGNGRIGTLDLRIRADNTARGTLTVSNAVQVVRVNQTGTTIDLGKYGISGTYDTATGRFACTGSINGEPFSLDVTPPTASASGSATLVYDGTTYGPTSLAPYTSPTATATGTATATATGTATATSAPGNGSQVAFGTDTAAKFNATLSNSAATGGNFSLNNATVSVQQGVQNSTALVVSGATTNPSLIQSPSFLLNKAGGPLVVGDEISVDSGTGNIVGLNVVRNVTNITTFVGTGGKVKITSVSGKKFEFSFSGITLEQQGNPSVTATMSGTGSANLK